MKNFKPLALAFSVSLLFLSATAQATQDARVSTSSATIYQRLNGKMKGIQQVTSGQILKVGDQEKSGWYACTIPGTNPSQLGWIRSTDITLGSSANASAGGGAPFSKNGRTATRSEPGTKGGWSVGITYDIAIVNPTQLQAASNLAPNPSMGSTLGFEIERPFATHFSLGARIDALMVGGKLASEDPAVGELGYSGFALPIVLLARYDLVDSPKFRLGAIVGAGLSPVTSYTATVGAVKTTASGMTLFIPATLEGDIRLGQRLSLVIELGYRMASPLSPVTLSGISMKSDFSSILGGGGLRVHF